jgi:RPA family protein
MKRENQMTSGNRREARFEREPARWVFAAELRESRHQFKEGPRRNRPTCARLGSGATGSS